MIDLVALRENTDTIRTLIAKKDPSYPVDKLLSLDCQSRELRTVIENLRQQKNMLAKQVHGPVTEEIRAASVALSTELAVKEVLFKEVQDEFQALYLSCPNVPMADLPEGGKEANKVVRTIGEKPVYNFPVKNHLELATAQGWLDFETAATIAGSGVPLYKKDAVSLLYGLTMLMLKNNKQHGFEPILPSVLVNERSLAASSHFPKFRDEVFAVPGDNLFLTPTAEVNLANLYRDKIVAAEELPIRMTAWTSCFRREGGGYGATERGLIRIRQFEKVELYSICKPEDSNQELEYMVSCAEQILKSLGLHYRVSLLAGQDCSFASAKTYDIEVWLPGQKAYYEVSSCSNCTDFQSRRGMIRYKTHAEDKAILTHTLNASSLALPRLMVALIETYQQEDGTIALPESIKKLFLF
jgi:seryl-tRNA synthetase